MADALGSSAAWRWLLVGEWRAHPARFLLAAFAIAVGVAMGFAVHAINRSAADAFGEAVRSVSGDADLQVRSTNPLGFDEALYPRLFALGPVADASPGLHLTATLGSGGTEIALLGLDMLRVLSVTPMLLPRPALTATADDVSSRPAPADTILDPGLIFLSQGALDRTGLRAGQKVLVRAGSAAHRFTVGGDMPGVPAGQSVGAIDIAAAQWRYGRLGKLDRIDLKLRAGWQPPKRAAWSRRRFRRASASPIPIPRAGAVTACRAPTASILTCWRWWRC